MGEVKNVTAEETVLPVKRRPDLECVDQEDYRKKKKSETSGNSLSVIEERQTAGDINADSGAQDADADVGAQEAVTDEVEDETDEEDSEDDGHLNGEAKLDGKGKGLMKEDKGKGKLKVEVESDDDSSDSGCPSDDDSDLSDNPLAEVDLENILPSRTRRRSAQPGAYLVNDIEDGDDSDDSDA